jgi:HD-GYP domain-containing protein (c-di-GMP phosphodiesterase class II)
MGLDEDYVHQIEKAAELMDIGMLKFGDNFRMDSPELGPREREMVRRHPIFSVEILQTVRSNWEILPLVRHHHEWWNGMGYPDGLKGEAIPLGARILCLADAFVAMVSPRAFREALDVKSALKEIEEYSGVQFDPRVARTFLDYMLSRIKGSIFINGDENDYPRAGREIGSSRITGNPAGVDDGKEFGCGIDEATLLDMLREIHVKP